MAFLTQYKRPKPVVTPSGSQFMNEYHYEIKDNGEKVLIQEGQTDRHALIQASAESVDINNIIARYVNGDVNALDRVQGLYADFSVLPTSLLEMYQRTEEATQVFEKLPVAIKERFNNSPSEFWSSMGTQEFLDAIKLGEPDNEPQKVSEGELEQKGDNQ